MENTWQNEDNLTNNFLVKFSKKYNINYQSNNEKLQIDILNKFYDELEKFIERKISFFNRKTYYFIAETEDLKKLLKKEAFNKIIDAISYINHDKQKNYYNQLQLKINN